MNSEISEKIKNLRLSEGLTQEEMSKILGCSVATVCGYETGKVNVSSEAIKNYMKHFRCSSDYFFNDAIPLMDNPGELYKNAPATKMQVLKNMALAPSGNNVYDEINHTFLDNPIGRKAWLMSKTDDRIEIAVIVEGTTFREGDHVVVVLDGQTTTHGYYYIDEQRRVCIKSKPKGNKGIRNIRVGLQPGDEIKGFIENVVVKFLI